MSKAHAVVARNTCTITLHYPTLHHTTQHHTTPDHTTPYHTTTTIAATTATTIAKYKYTTLHYVTLLTLQYSTTTATAALHHTTSSSCGWGDRCNHCSHSKKYSSNLNHVDSLCHPCVATIHLSYSVLYNETFATALCGTTGKTCFQLSCHALPAFRWCFCNVTAFNMSDLQHPCQYHTHGLHESRLRLWEWKALPSERWNLRKMMEEYLAAVEAGNPWANNCNYLPQAWHENAWKECCRNVCNMCVESRKASLRLPRPNSSTNPLVQLWPWTTDVFLIQWTRSLAMQDDARPRGGNPKAQKARGFAPVTNSNFVTYKSYKI